jgi:hypothetical protein
VYSLATTPGYDAELARIGPNAQLTQELERTLYAELRRNSAVGQPARAGGFVLRRRLLMGLLLVQITYEVDDAARSVTLVSIREIDQTRL